MICYWCGEDREPAGVARIHSSYEKIRNRAEPLCSSCVSEFETRRVEVEEAAAASKRFLRLALLTIGLTVVACFVAVLAVT